MSSLRWLSALLHTLAAKGSLGQIKARIRSEIFSALDSADDTAPKAPLSNTNLLINELVREYLEFNQYRYTLNVFLPESNQPEVSPFERGFIAKELHVQENQHSVQMSARHTTTHRAWAQRRIRRMLGREAGWALAR